MNDYKEQYLKYRYELINKYNFNEKKIASKWSPIIFMKNDMVITTISIFLEIYQLIEQDFSCVNINHINIQKYSYPDDYINLTKALELFNYDLKNFIKNDTNTKYKIISEYYNGVTMKKGFLLENNIRVEDNNFLDSKINDKINKELKFLIDSRIEYILEPCKRKLFERSQKLKRIIDGI
jgi:hypothetical protein